VRYASAEYFVSAPRRDTRDDCDLLAVGTCLISPTTGQVPTAGRNGFWEIARNESPILNGGPATLPLPIKVRVVRDPQQPRASEHGHSFEFR